MGDVWSKTRSLGQILEKPCVRSRGHIFSPIIMKHDQNVCLDESLNEFEARSPSQILEKPYIPSIGHISSQIMMKLCHNVCFDEISDEFENGSCGIKK